MNNVQHPSKQIIRERMTRFAGSAFNFPHANQLDPAVRLLLESLSGEIYKLYGEIEHAENRISDKLQQLLAYHPETSAEPAHCILHAYPQEDSVEVSMQTEFSHFSKKKNACFSFYPTSNIRLYKASVKYFIHKNTMYAVTKNAYKRPEFFMDAEDSNAAVCWLGVDVSENIENLSGITFFIDLLAASAKNKHLNLLSHAKWEIGDYALSMENDMFPGEKRENEVDNLFAQLDVQHEINVSVNRFYKNQLFIVKNDCDIRNRRTIFPDELSLLADEELFRKISKPLIWIKVTFPKEFAPEVIDSLQITVNAFPAINKELISKVEEINAAMPAIPLRTENNEAFIAVSHVSNSDGKVFYDVPPKTETADAGVYSVKKGGVERYSTCDGNEYLSDKIDMLKNEAASFLPTGNNNNNNDLIRERVHKLIQYLTRTIETVKGNCEPTNYLLIHSEKGSQIYFVNYWVTNCEEANFIREGAVFNAVANPSVTTSFSLTQTVGGRQALPKNREHSLLRQSLSEHRSLISVDDIRNFCLTEFAELIRNVEIKSGYMPVGNSRTDFIRTTDVYLIPHHDKAVYIDESTVKHIEQTLNKNSPATYKYRVLII